MNTFLSYLPSRCELIIKLVQSLLCVALACKRGVGQSEVIILRLVPWNVTLVAWNMEVLVSNRGTLLVQS